MKKELIALLLLIFLIGCNQNEEKLTYDKTSFAVQLNDGTFQPLENKTYNRGEAVHLVMLNVKEFRKDNYGLNAFDINVEVSKDGTVIISQANLLGEGGNINLENNIAKSPYGSFNSDKSLEPGNYTFKMTIKDLITNTEVSAVENFQLV